MDPLVEAGLGTSLRTSDLPDDSKATPLRTTSFTSVEGGIVEVVERDWLDDA